MAYIKCIRNLVSSTVPDGKTVTPTDDVQILLACAGITDKSYTTLTELFADTATLASVIADNNAIDYLKRSTSFATIKVPIMTSNTTPSGRAFCEQTLNSGSYAYYAFDDNSSTYVEGNSVSHDVAYEFTNPVNILSMDYDIQYYTSIKAQYSDNGTTWQDASNTVSMTSSAYQTGVVNITETSAHKYWRFYGSQDGAGAGYIKTIQFNGNGFTDNSTAMSYIGLNNYASNTLLADSTWCNAICNSTYFESVLNGKVPTMTSNTTPSGVASASAETTNRNAYIAFTNNDSSVGWEDGTSNTGWLQYEFDSPKKVYIATYYVNSTIEPYRTYAVDSVMCSNDGDGVSGGSDTSANQDKKIIMSTYATAYKKYRFNVHKLSTAGALGCTCTKAQLYYREDV